MPAVTAGQSAVALSNSQEVHIGSLSKLDRYTLTMRRWLSILLLVFLPFQFSWAAVGTYCEHESGARAKHFGHHEHEHKHKHQQPAGESGEASKVKLGGASNEALDVADCHFHCQCTVDLPAALGMPMVIGSHALTDWTMADAIAPVLSRPERPQWVDHA